VIEHVKVLDRQVRCKSVSIFATEIGKTRRLVNKHDTEVGRTRARCERMSRYARARSD